MERIRKAIAKAKHEQSKLPTRAHRRASSSIKAELSRASEPRRKSSAAKNPSKSNFVPRESVKLNHDYLQNYRILAYDHSDKRTAHYDMLRTRVLQSLFATNQKSIAVTSPLANVGKTVTSANLAFSIARQSEQSVLLVDMDLRKAPIAKTLGLKPDHGIDDIVSGTCSLASAIIDAEAGTARLSVLAMPRPAKRFTESIVSSAMVDLIDELHASEEFNVIIFDLPPMLQTDDFIAFLPQVDNALLVVASGESTQREINECYDLIGGDKFLGCVLNKARDDQTAHGYYGG